MKLDIKHDEGKRFYVNVEGQTGELKYKKIDDDTLDFTSTFVPKSLRNQGIAGEIAQHALEYAKKHHYKVVPTCSFVKGYIEKHPNYADLVK